MRFDPICIPSVDKLFVNLNFFFLNKNNYAPKLLIFCS